jgi:hypothetical protein
MAVSVPTECACLPTFPCGLGRFQSFAHFVELHGGTVEAESEGAPVWFSRTSR